MREERQYYVYIMASKSRRLYTGMTNSIMRRAKEHKAGMIDGFTKRYRINRLVYYESFRYVGNAINREKQIKGWDRAKRVALIESVNRTWEDLSDGWGEAIPGFGEEQQIPRGVTTARDDHPAGSAPDDNPEGRHDAHEKQIPRGPRPARDDNPEESRDTEQVEDAELTGQVKK